MTRKKFLRRTGNRYSKLGKKRKKKQKWKRPTGRHNKMREKRKSYSKTVSIGYKKNKKSRGSIRNKKPVTVHNLKDLEKIQKDEIAIIGKVGKKKKIEIAKRAKEMKIHVYNINLEKFLKKEIGKKENKNETRKEKRTG